MTMSFTKSFIFSTSHLNHVFLNPTYDLIIQRWLFSWDFLCVSFELFWLYSCFLNLSRFSADWGLLHGFGWGFDQISACTKPSTNESSCPHGRGHIVSSKGLTLETHLWADQGTLAIGSTWLPFEVGIHFQSSSHSHFRNYKVFIFIGRISLWIETFLFDSLNCSLWMS